ncbi:MAG TPA: hypothetical protein VEL77_08770 [Rugosimonospora sp.]|nr:hypothetical protein [Rugosimonospora sp.]
MLQNRVDGVSAHLQRAFPFQHRPNGQYVTGSIHSLYSAMTLAILRRDLAIGLLTVVALLAGTILAAVARTHRYGLNGEEKF